MCLVLPFSFVAAPLRNGAAQLWILFRKLVLDTEFSPRSGDFAPRSEATRRSRGPRQHPPTTHWPAGLRRSAHPGTMAINKNFGLDGGKRSRDFWRALPGCFGIRRPADARRAKRPVFFSAGAFGGVMERVARNEAAKKKATRSEAISRAQRGRKDGTRSAGDGSEQDAVFATSERSDTRSNTARRRLARRQGGFGGRPPSGLLAPWRSTTGGRTTRPRKFAWLRRTPSDAAEAVGGTNF